MVTLSCQPWLTSMEKKQLGYAVTYQTSEAQLMRISIEGPEIDAVEFEEKLEICKEHNHRILL